MAVRDSRVVHNANRIHDTPETTKDEIMIASFQPYQPAPASCNPKTIKHDAEMSKIQPRMSMFFQDCRIALVSFFFGHRKIRGIAEATMKGVLKM